MIYFVTSHLNQLVHVQALGFTRHVHDYARADTPEGASAKAAAHYARHPGLRVLRSETRPAFQQDLGAYTFPEQIL
jgi:hypothetical protein